MFSDEISLPAFYDNLVFKLRKVKSAANFRLDGLDNSSTLRRRIYDQEITERTIGLVLGPSTFLYRSFLEHWTLTNKGGGDYMKGLVQTSSDETRPRSSSTMIVIRDFFWPLYLILLPDGRKYSLSDGCLYAIVLTLYVCVMILKASPLWLAVNPRSL